MGYHRASPDGNTGSCRPHGDALPDLRQHSGCAYWLVAARSRERAFDCLRPSAPSGECTRDRNQDDCANERDDDALDVEAADHVAAEHKPCQESTDQSTDNAQHDVTDHPIPATLHHLTRQPTRDETKDNPHNNGHTYPSS